MAQDSDVARVAAAMNAPGFKYRSFGNEPVRIRPGTTGTLAQPPAEPQVFYADPVLPPPTPLPEPIAAAPLAYDDGADAFDYEPFATAADEPLPLAGGLPGALPEPAAAMPPVAYPAAEPLRDEAADPVSAAPEPPPAPLFSWPETPAYAPPPAAAPALFPQLAQPEPAPAMPAAAEPAAMPAGGYRLLESIGHRPGQSAAPQAAAQPGGTLALLRRAAEGAGDSSTTMAGINLGTAHAGPLPPLSPSGHQSGLLPAAAVTVPLSDVMRLIAAGATPPPSPFDAFRAALGAQPGR